MRNVASSAKYVNKPTVEPASAVSAIPASSITATLANEFAEASSDLHRASLIYLGLVLFIITFIVLSLSKLLLMRLRRNEGRTS